MIEIKKTNQNNKGQVIVLTAIFFLAISMVIIFGVTNPVLSSYAITKSFLSSKESFLLADSASSEAMYRMRNSFAFADSEVVTLAQGSANVVVSSVLNGKHIEVDSNVGSYKRKIGIDVIAGVGANFNYGIQVGNGGFFLENNSNVVGNVYANGSIVGDAGSYITGSAIAAATTPEQLDQLNEISGVPTNEIIFSTVDDPDFAQSFKSATSSSVGKVSFYIKKSGSPSSGTVRIHSDNSGNPGNVLGSIGVLDSSLVTTSYGWVDVVFPTAIPVVDGTTYWITIDTSPKNNKSYILGAQNAYPNGKSKIGTYNTSWTDVSPLGLDAGFRVFVGVNDSVVQNVRVGTKITDDTWANTVMDVTALGTIYCQNESGNNKACDKTKPDPETQPMPLSDANIDQFISEAESGTLITGNYNASSTTYLGPAKINGNLTVDGTLVLTGTVYVTGNLNSSNNSVIKLSPGYGSFSGTLIVDGISTLSNNVNFLGSGSPNSYVLLVSRSECPFGAGCSGQKAIDVNNNVGTVILNAQKGEIYFSNNAGAKSATAKLIHLNNNVSIQYESGLANLNFSSGPSGGWNISSWEEIE